MTTGMAPDEASALLASAVQRAERAGSWLAESVLRMLQAVLAGRTGDHATAARGLAGLLGTWGRRGSWRYEWNTVREAMVVLARNGRHEDVLVLLAASERSDAAPGLVGEQQELFRRAADTAMRALGETPARSARSLGHALDDAEAAEHARDALLALADSATIAS